MKEWEGVREQYKEFKPVEQSQPWFKVYDIGKNILAIYEPYHFQEVISYLIKGEDKALLWDTGLGIGDMKKCVEELWDKEVIVVNSHHHFDHIGSNWQFDEVNIFDHEEMIKAVTVPLADSYVGPEYAEDQFSDEAPIKEHTYEFKPVNYVTFKEGKVFDLGNRSFRVIHTPGHAKDEIMLVSDEEKLLFTGDEYYPAPMYCFENTFDTYIEVMDDLAKKYSDYTLVTSHNEPYRHGSIFIDIAKGFKEIAEGKKEPKCEMRNGEREWFVFDTFSVIKKK
ncbi:MAG: MBL fold metallo-hydrolase [Erysipelotrichaceae bacterium]|nr:MBL fold metallo-hydrolase [Erysipelotrichaceae bacterium]